ncbi:hypothetical protein [Histidinibacterium lentulum]|uniref:Uncharacterized protein n=1 Tax=Histidinibacterium lentulum TaxID=2480588 RepID=A0A3N2R541_9RHOB|nr:hypothetical protein [Histidinibacterium lentulum]ROU02544.1 hypothetical protein EAT49_09430 [Histidinibacterium lentulum]
MAFRFSRRPRGPGAKPGSAEGRKRRQDEGGPGLAVAAALLCGPLALVSVPVLWWSGTSLAGAVVLTVLLQLSVFLAVLAVGCYRSKRAGAGGLSEGPQHDPVAPDLAIWQSYSRLEGEGDPPRVALVAPPSVQTRQIATDLAEQGHDVQHTTDADAMFDSVRARPADWRFMIVDLDLFDDLADGVDELISFRQDCAAIPVLLLSGSVSRDELSGHRRAIGDATLQKPVFRCRLLVGIDAMWENRLADDGLADGPRARALRRG